MAKPMSVTRIIKLHKRKRSLLKEGRTLFRGHPRRKTLAMQIRATRNIIKKGIEGRMEEVSRTGKGLSY